MEIQQALVTTGEFISLATSRRRRQAKAQQLFERAEKFVGQLEGVNEARDDDFQPYFGTSIFTDRVYGPRDIFCSIGDIIMTGKPEVRGEQGPLVSHKIIFHEGYGSSDWANVTKQIGDPNSYVVRSSVRRFGGPEGVDNTAGALINTERLLTRVEKMRQARFPI